MVERLIISTLYGLLFELLKIKNNRLIFKDYGTVGEARGEASFLKRVYFSINNYIYHVTQYVSRTSCKSTYQLP